MGIRERWLLPGHDGLTVDHLEGARRLGWLTVEEIEEMTDGD